MMVDAKDNSQELAWFNEERAKIVITNLKRRGINAQYVPTRQEALSVIMQMIPEGTTVFRGDSITMEQIGVIDEVRKSHRYKFVDTHDRNEDGSSKLESRQRRMLQREASLADVFLTGTNAITMDGKLVNVDGLGSRVAPMIFGPEKVIVAVGVNKIVKDLSEALERIHQVAAPLNTRRHYARFHVEEYATLPCVKTGRCVYCTHEYKCCNITTIIDGELPKVRGRLNVVLVGEELGL